MGCLLSSFLLSLCVGERKDGDDEVEVRLGSNDDEVLLVASSFLVSRFTTASFTSRSVDPLRKTSTALPHLCMFSVFLSLKLVSAVVEASRFDYSVLIGFCDYHETMNK